MQPASVRKHDGTSIVHFDALSTTKNNANHQKSRSEAGKDSRLGSIHGVSASRLGASVGPAVKGSEFGALAAHRGSMQSNSAYGMGTMASRRGEKEESPAKDVPPKVARASAVAIQDKSLHGLSQIGGGNHVQSVFNDGDMSMMEEVNKLLAGLGGMNHNKRGSINSWRVGGGTSHRASVEVEPVSTRGNDFMLPMGPRQQNLVNEFAPIASSRATGLSNAMGGTNGTNSNRQSLTRNGGTYGDEVDNGGTNNGPRTAFGNAAQLGKTMEDISKIELAGDDQSAFISQYPGRDNSAMRRE